MRIHEIKDSVFYCGVNDRTTEKFENLWPLPYGVSYNSYIVKGSEKIALIDTVEAGNENLFFKGIRSIIGGRKIDYLVINHMEPDHSGGIPAILKEYPEIKIIGNRQTKIMLAGFYSVPDSCFIEIKDNETISLGDRNLRFIMTPMVHWPETMMTYVEEIKLLFSGDAFGCFGALNGGVTDTEMDTSWYTDEIYRYYSNIVGKYGKFVQSALNKISKSGIEIDYICSTHGPVWHERLKEVVGIYDRLSRYEGEDGVTIVYGSMYGNTKEIAELIADRLSERGVRIIKIHDSSKSDLSYMISDAFRYKGLIVGSPTYSMHLFPPVEEFMVSMETREIKNKSLAFFGSYTWSSVTTDKFKEYSQKMNMECVGCMEMKHSPNDEAYKNARELADKVYDAMKK